MADSSNAIQHASFVQSFDDPLESSFVLNISFADFNRVFIQKFNMHARLAGT
jgi:hypothetical protein